MSITDELRLFAADPYTGWVPTDKQQADLRAIADRIDAEHESACAEAYGNGVESVALPDMTAYVKLPVDADGVPFRIGDKVDSEHYEDGTVIGINYFKAPNGVVREEITVQPNGWDVATWRDPEEYTHHRADTWESIIKDAIGEGMARERGNKECCEHSGALSNADLVARCRALAGDAE